MTPADLYCMAMESKTAENLMHELCRALNTPYPPRPDDYTEIGKLQAIQLQQRQWNRPITAPQTETGTRNGKSI